MADHLAESVDLEAVLRIARTAPDLDDEAWDPSAEVTSGSDRRPVVAMAGGRAFTFRYTETEELLRAAGCDVVTFDPLTERELPAGTSGLYLGGGFPEVHAAALTANTSLREHLRAAVAAGVPTVAECAGLLYLCSSVDGSPMVGALPVTAEMTPRLTLRYPTATSCTDSLLTRVGEQVTGHEFHRTQVTPASGEQPAWTVDGQPIGFASATVHASYLHTHWAGHPHLAQRFADAVHAAAPGFDTGARAPCSTDEETPPAAGFDTGARAPCSTDEQSPDRGPSSVEQGRQARVETKAPSSRHRAPTPVSHPLRHHGDAEASPGLLDLAVNVYAGPRPAWLDTALHASLEQVDRYPSATAAEEAIARRHGRNPTEVLATAGAAEAFTLLARLRPWTRPVVVHPQFTEPHAALEQAGHVVTVVHCRPEDGFTLDADAVPADADLVVLGNPTNPTGVLHPADVVRRLLRPGRVVVVDEAFMDTVPGEPESLAAEHLPGLVVVRSLTKHWGIPGVRAGYLLAEPDLVDQLRAGQSPWSVSTTAAAAMTACSSDDAATEATHRARTIAGWRTSLEAGLAARRIPHVGSSASFVLAEVGAGVHADLRAAGIAVRRADTFPGLGPTWVRIAVRPEEQSDQLLATLDALRSRASDALG